MVSWRFGVPLAIIAMSAMPQIDCDPLADPAMRLEHCLERAVAGLSRPGEVARAACDVKLPGRYTVVLHPPGELSDEDLLFAGLPEALLPELRTMRSKRGPAMYVFASDRTVTGIGIKRTVPSSRTTTQSMFVEINELMVVTRTTQPLTVEVARTQDAAVIRRIR